MEFAEPPTTTVGFSDNEEMDTASTVSVACSVPLYEAEMVTGVFAPTEFVEIGKVADKAPDGTVMLPGTVAADVLLLLRVTTVPPLGATPFRVMVPVAEFPPVKLAALNAKPVSWLACATEPITAISARPMFWPTAVFTVNFIDVTVFGENETVSGEPLLGKALT